MDFMLAAFGLESFQWPLAPHWARGSDLPTAQLPFKLASKSLLTWYLRGRTMSCNEIEKDRPITRSLSLSKPDRLFPVCDEGPSDG